MSSNTKISTSSIYELAEFTAHITKLQNDVLHLKFENALLRSENKLLENVVKKIEKRYGG